MHGQSWQWQLPKQKQWAMFEPMSKATESVFQEEHNINKSASWLRLGAITNRMAALGEILTPWADSDKGIATQTASVWPICSVAAAGGQRKVIVLNFSEKVRCMWNNHMVGRVNNSRLGKLTESLWLCHCHLSQMSITQFYRSVSPFAKWRGVLK